MFTQTMITSCLCPATTKKKEHDRHKGLPLHVKFTHTHKHSPFPINQVSLLLKSDTNLTF